MGCVNSKRNFEVETAAWLFQAPYATRTRGRKRGKNFRWMMDHDYKGEMKSTSRILGNFWGHLLLPLFRGTRVTDTYTGKTTNDHFPQN